MREFFTIAIFKIKADIRMNNPPPEQSERETFYALLAESDVKLKSSCCCNRVISIHALLAEGDVPRARLMPA